MKGNFYRKIFDIWDKSEHVDLLLSAETGDEKVKNMTVLGYGNSTRLDILCTRLKRIFPEARIKYIIITQTYAPNNPTLLGIENFLKIPYKDLTTGKILEISRCYTDLLLFYHDKHFIDNYSRVALLAVLFKAGMKVRYMGGLRRFYSYDFLKGFVVKVLRILCVGAIFRSIILCLLFIVASAKALALLVLLPFKDYNFKDIEIDIRDFAEQSIRHVSEYPMTEQEPLWNKVMLELLVIKEFLQNINIVKHGKSVIPKRIALIRLEHLGDVTMTTGALVSLKKIYPDSNITLYVGPWCKELVQNCPYAEIEIFETNFHHFNRGARIKGYLPKLFRLYMKMRREKFDLAFEFSGRTEGFRLLYLTGAKRKIAYNYNDWNFYYNIELSEELQGKNETERVSYLLEKADPALSFCYNELWLSVSEKQEALSYLMTMGYNQNALMIALHPGGKLPAKLWPAENFRKLSSMIIKYVERPCQILVIADNDEEDLVANFLASGIKPFTMLAVGQSLRMMMALIARSDLFIGNDSGPMHIADTFGIPVVVTFGPTDDGRWAPLDKVKHLVVKKPIHCSPCAMLDCDDNLCLKNISVDEVWANLKPRLDRLLSGGA